MRTELVEKAVGDVDWTARDWEILAQLGGPTYFRIAGQDRARTRVVVTLLHGNEPSGLRAMGSWLACGVTPATDALLCIVSVAAALRPPPFSSRMLPGRRDANRCFFPPYLDEEGRLAEQLLSLLKQTQPEALVDLHNNTGHSPAYGVGAGVDVPRLNLTALFGDRYMNSNLSMGTLIEATSGWFPSIVIECGRAGDPVADAIALAGVERFLSRDTLSLDAPTPAQIQILHDPVRVTPRSDASIAFADAPLSGVSLTVRGNLDRHNFEPLDAGVVIGWIGQAEGFPLTAVGVGGDDLVEQLFERHGAELRTRRPMVPVMMTQSIEIAKSDCLFYAMRAETP